MPLNCGTFWMTVPLINAFLENGAIFISNGVNSSVSNTNTKGLLSQRALILTTVFTNATSCQRLRYDTVKFFWKRQGIKVMFVLVLHSTSIHTEPPIQRVVNTWSCYVYGPSDNQTRAHVVKELVVLTHTRDPIHPFTICTPTYTNVILVS